MRDAFDQFSYFSGNLVKLDSMDIDDDIISQEKMKLNNSTDGFEKGDSDIGMESNEMPVDEERSVPL